MNQSAVVQYALEPLAVELREVLVPEIGEDDVLLRVGAVSVCGSDVHQCYNTHSWPVNLPVILGHEFAGTVAKTGRAVKGFICEPWALAHAVDITSFGGWRAYLVAAQRG